MKNKLLLFSVLIIVVFVMKKQAKHLKQNQNIHEITTVCYFYNEKNILRVYFLDSLHIIM